ncbi:MAG: hypothetical protein IT521_15335 [Burkholderiales bacterium]|nr:hypothetical protein [Burkholderiales bacterium]
MTVDLWELEIDYIVMETRRTRNTWRLVECLRDDRLELHPKLRALCADVLSGKVNASYSEPPYRPPQWHVRREVEMWRKLLADGDARVIQIVRERGIEGADDGRRRSTIAKTLAAEVLGVSVDKIGRMLFPRKDRNKPSV